MGKASGGGEDRGRGARSGLGEGHARGGHGEGYGGRAGGEGLKVGDRFRIFFSGYCRTSVGGLPEPVTPEWGQRGQRLMQERR